MLSVTENVCKLKECVLQNIQFNLEFHKVWFKYMTWNVKRILFTYQGFKEEVYAYTWNFSALFGKEVKPIYFKKINISGYFFKFVLIIIDLKKIYRVNYLLHRFFPICKKTRCLNIPTDQPCTLNACIQKLFSLALPAKIN